MPESRTPPPSLHFQPTVFAERLAGEHGEAPNALVKAPSQLAEAFEALSRSPAWREDPRLRSIAPGIADEVLDHYNAVIEDGRYVAEFITDPRAVAGKLKRRISKQAAEVVVAAGRTSRSDAGVVAAGVVISVSVVAVAVTTAIVSSHADRRDRILVDESGRVKLGDQRKKRRVTQAKKKKKLA